MTIRVFVVRSQEWWKMTNIQMIITANKNSYQLTFSKELNFLLLNNSYFFLRENLCFFSLSEMLPEKIVCNLVDDAQIIWEISKNCLMLPANYLGHCTYSLVTEMRGTSQVTKQTQINDLNSSWRPT